jgi:hypothetical protein
MACNDVDDILEEKKSLLSFLPLNVRFGQSVSLKSNQSKQFVVFFLSHSFPAVIQR